MLEMPRLVIAAPETLHLLSLILRERVESALATVEGRERARRLRGSLGLVAGGMQTRLVFDGQVVSIDQDAVDKSDARASGTLASFLAICHGKVRFGDVLKRQVRVSGNLLLLRRALPILSIGVLDEQD